MSITEGDYRGRLHIHGWAACTYRPGIHAVDIPLNISHPTWAGMKWSLLDPFLHTWRLAKLVQTGRRYEVKDDSNRWPTDLKPNEHFTNVHVTRICNIGKELFFLFFVRSKLCPNYGNRTVAATHVTFTSLFYVNPWWQPFVMSTNKSKQIQLHLLVILPQISSLAIALNASIILCYVPLGFLNLRFV